MREWNPNWRDVVPNYIPMRRMILASINWIEQWPAAYPQWLENDGCCSDHWPEIYQPTNDHARQWFTAIAGRDRPSPLMMGYAIRCGETLSRLGWDRFNNTMLKQR